MYRMIYHSLFYLFMLQGGIHLLGIAAIGKTNQENRWDTDSRFVLKIIGAKNQHKFAISLYLLISLLFFCSAFSYEGIYINATIWLDLLVVSVSISFISLDIFPNAIKYAAPRKFAIGLNFLIIFLYLYFSSALQGYA